MGYHLEQWHLESSSIVNNVEFWYSKIIIPESHHLAYLTLEYLLPHYPVKIDQCSSTNNE